MGPIIRDRVHGWVMLPHNFPGTWKACDGGMTVPQAVINVPEDSFFPEGKDEGDFDEWL
jgi:hypothetical protein